MDVPLAIADGSIRIARPGTGMSFLSEAGTEGIAGIKLYDLRFLHCSNDMRLLVSCRPTQPRNWTSADGGSLANSGRSATPAPRVTFDSSRPELDQ